MQSDDRAAIEGLFGRLSEVQHRAPERDGEAEAFINDRIAAQPAAPYYMAQTLVVQEHALAQAQARIEALEAERAQAANAGGGGGLFGGLFGGGAPQPSPQPSPQPRPAAPPPSASGVPSTAGRTAPQALPQQQRSGGGFLAGAAQTAMGVAGGILVANAIGDMMGGGEAEAAEAPMDDGGLAEDPMAGMEEESGGGILDIFGGGDDEW